MTFLILRSMHYSWREIILFHTRNSVIYSAQIKNLALGEEKAEEETETTETSTTY